MREHTTVVNIINNYNKSNLFTLNECKY
jgi:hypothetical protein